MPVPTFNPVEVRDLYKQLKSTPDLFSAEEAEALTYEAQRLLVPEALYQPDKPISVTGVFRQLGQNFISGWTTIDFGPPPENSIEAIAAGLGHLAGFAGYIPGPGLAVKAGGIVARLGAGGAARTSGMLAKSFGIIAETTRLKSVPMLAADAVTGGISRILARSSAFEASKILGKATVGRDIVKGALHLGIASAVDVGQPWELNIQERMSAFTGGVEAGAFFRIAGNTINRNALVDMKKLGIFDTAKSTNVANAVVRSFASSLYMGIPATYHDYPTELQVYEYALGAFFGFNEKSVHQRSASDFLRPYWKNNVERNKLIAPRLLDGWGRLSDQAKEEVLIQSDSIIGKAVIVADQFEEVLKRAGFPVVTEAGVVLSKAVSSVLNRLVAEGKMSAEQAAQIRLGKDVKDNVSSLVEAGEDFTSAKETVVTELGKQFLKAPAEQPTTVIDQENRFQSFKTTTQDVVEHPNRLTEYQMYQDHKVPLSFQRGLNEVAESISLILLKNMPATEQNVPKVSSIVREATKIPLDTPEAQIPIEFLRKGLATSGVAAEEMLNLSPRQLLELYIGKGLDAPSRVGTGPGEGDIDPSKGEAVESHLKQQADPRVVKWKLVKELGKRLQDPSPDSFRKFIKYADGLAKGLDMQSKPSVYNPIRQTWLQSKFAKHVDMLMYDSSKKEFVKVPQVNVEGKRTKLVAAPGLLDRIIPGKLIATSALTARTDTKTGEVFREMENISNQAPVDIFKAVQKAGLAFYGGSKDGSKYILGKYLVSYDNGKWRLIGEPERSIDMFEIASKLDKIAIETNGRSWTQEMLSERASWEKAGLSPEEFDRAVANQIAFLEKLNGVDYVTQMMNPGKFLNTAVSLNKRLQVLNAGEVLWEAESFKDIADVFPTALEGGIRFAIVRAPGNVEGKTNPMQTVYIDSDASKRPVLRDGVDVKDIPHLAHMDGPFILRDDIYDAAARDGGFDLNTSSQKGVALVRGSGGEGLLIGKYAYHRAGKKLSGDMKSTGLHGWMMDTAVKQSGLRNAVDVTVDAKGGITYSDPSAVYTARFSELTHNLSAGERASTAKQNQRLPIQFYKNILRDKGGAEAQEDLRVLQNQAWFGDPVENVKLGTEQESSVDLDKLGAQQFYNLVDGPNVKNTPLFQKAVKRLFNMADDPNFWVSEDQNVDAHAEGVEALRSPAERTLRSGVMSPEILQLNHVRPYFRSVLLKLMANRVTRPEMPNSAKSISYPWHPVLHRTIDLKPGEFMLNNDMKDWKVRFGHEEIGLGKAWTIYRETLAEHVKLGKESKLGSLITEMEEDLSVLTERVPTDSASGVRLLNFKGFTGVDGHGIMLHPEDMNAFSGMDQDIDSAFLFQGFSRKVKKYYKAQAEEWMEERIVVDPKTGKSTHKNIMIPSKQSPSLLEKDLTKERKHMFDVVNPMKLMLAHNAASLGNSTLGVGLNIKTRLAFLRDGILAGDNKLKGSLQPSSRNAERLGRDLVQYAADAGDGYLLKSRKELRETLMDASFKSLDKQSRKNIGDLMFTLQKMEQVYRGTSSAIEKGDSFGKLDALGTQITILRAGLGIKTGTPLPSNFYHGIELFSQLKLSKFPYSFLGENTGELFKNFDLFFNGKSPEAVLARQLTLRSRLEVNLGEWRNSQLYKDTLASDGRITQATLDLSRDMVIQNIWDIVSGIHMSKIAKQLTAQGGTIGRLREIAQQVEKFKMRESARRTSVFSIRKKGIAATTSQLESELFREMHDYWKSLTPTEQSYADAYAISSLYKQDLSYPGFQRRLRNQIVRAEAEFRDAQKGTNQEEVNRTYEALQVAKRNKANVADLYNRRNFSTFAFSLDFINPNSLRSMLKMYTDVVGKTFETKITPEDVKTMFGFEADIESVSPGSSKMHVADQIKPVAAESTKPLAGSVFESMGLPEFPFKAEVKPDDPNVPEQAVKAPDFLRHLRELAATPLEGDPEKLRTLRDIQQKVEDVLYHSPNLIKHFPDLFEFMTQGVTGVGTTPSSATLMDIYRFLNEMSYEGKFFDEVKRANKDLPFKKKFWFFFPERLDKIHRPYDQTIFEIARQPVIVGPGMIAEKPVKMMLSRIGTLVKANFQIHSLEDRDIKNLEFFHKDILRKVGSIPNGDGARIWEIASAQREAARAEPENSKLYTEEAIKATEEFKKYANKKYTFARAGGGSETKTGTELLEEYKVMQNEWAVKSNIIYFNKAAETMLIKFVEGGYEGEIDLKETLRPLTKKIIEEGVPQNLGINGLYRIIHQIVTNKIPVNYQGKMQPLGEVANPNVRAALVAGLKADPRYTKFLEFKSLEDQFIEHGSYYPHNNFPKAEVEARATAEAANRKAKAEKVRAVLDVLTKAAEADSPDMGMAEEVQDMLNAPLMTPEKMENSGLFARPPHIRARNTEAGPLPNWDKGPGAMQRHDEQLVRGYWNLLSSVIAHEVTRAVKREQPMGKFTDQWVAFMQTYQRSNLGLPSYFPKEWLDNKQYNIKNSPYFYFTDEYWKKWAKYTSKRFFDGEALGTEETKQAERLFSRKLAVLSNLDAKWNLLSLLANTKTAVNNLFGGNTNTIIDTGFRPYRNAGSLQYLRDHIDPSWKSKDDIRKWVSSHGAIESFIKDELLTRGQISPEVAGALAKDIFAKVQGDKDLSRFTLRELATKHGVTEAIVSLGAAPMRFTELRLRERSWLTHYIKAREVLEVNNFTFDDRSHPWLIQMANKGVTATQFIYNNSSRPAFAATSMGRIYSRFQLWAWNSIKFRRDIYNEARLYGIEGSEEQERYKRLVTADLFVLALATLFPASMFDSALPAPLSYLQDLSAFFFGNKEDRDKAFYGTLPYPANIIQSVSPPSSRLLFPAFNYAVSGDWDATVGKTVWTLFPFGAMGKNVYKTMENPMMALDNLAGIPTRKMTSLQKQSDKRKKNMKFMSPTGPLQGSIKSVFE